MTKIPKTEELEHMRHSLAHLLAAAVLELYPDAKRAIGPTIENGFYYDFEFSSPISEKDLHPIENAMRELLHTWRQFEEVKETAKSARERYADNSYKLELVDEIVSKDEKITSYKSGEFIDLCRGGHVKDAKEIKPDSFKLTHLAGAYWRGDEKNKMLTRIYGLAFPTKKELDDYLTMMEEAKKRDHRKLGKELDLFTFSEKVGPGLPLWTSKGTTIKEELEKFGKETEAQWGYERVSTPHIAKEELFKTSGHLPYYKDDLYPGMKLDDATYYLKAMNCPMTMELFASKPRSYRDLPMRLAEYGTVYRYELSGVLSGLLRVRGFTQNDAHIFCREDQVEHEFVEVMNLHEYYYRDIFGIKDYYIRLSLRDKTKENKFGGNDEIWDKAETTIRNAIKKSGVPFEEVVGEASFYGPKADFQIKSVIGREETASTNQIDFIMPQRFGLTYTGEDGKDHPVVVIHRAPLGSHERFIGFLIEHYAGAFPLWLSPVQIAVLPISDKVLDYSTRVVAELKQAGLRVELNEKSESISKKIREAEMQKIPYLIVIGEKEKTANVVAVRKRGKGDEGTCTLPELIHRLKQEVEKKS